MSTRLVVFDCDGTLVDSAHVIVTAMREAFERQDLAVPPDEDVRRVVGLSLPQAMAKLLPGANDALHLALAAGYKDAFLDLRAQGVVNETEVLYPGVEDSLRQLERAGYLLGVATGKSQRGLLKTLEHHGLRDLFVTLQTADHHPSKPHPSMLQQAMVEAGAQADHTVLIGDTTYDMEMARAANVRGLGVTWGYHGEAELTRAGAEEIHRDYEGLTRALVEKIEI